MNCEGSSTASHSTPLQNKWVKRAPRVSGSSKYREQDVIQAKDP